MNCQECEALFDDMLDRKVQEPLRQRMELHLTRCASCRDALERRRRNHALLFRAFNSVQCAKHLPDDFANRLLEECNRSPAWRWSFSMPRWALVAASLALLLAGFVFAAAIVAAEGTEGTEEAEGMPDEAESPLAVPTVNPVSSVPFVPSLFSSTQQGTQAMNTKQAATAALVATLSAAPLAAARGDGYQFIISGDPVAAALAGSSSASSATSSLVGGPLAAGCVVAAALEGRFRTADDSATGALRSDKAVGTIISIR